MKASGMINEEWNLVKAGRKIDGFLFSKIQYFTIISFVISTYCDTKRLGDSGKVWTICCCAPLHQKDFFWSICLLLHYNQPPIIGTMPIRDIGELPYPHLLCWRPMKVNRSHSVRTNSIFAINSSIVSQNYFNGSHLSPNNTRTCHQLICVDFVTKCRS